MIIDRGRFFLRAYYLILSLTLHITQSVEN